MEHQRTYYHNADASHRARQHAVKPRMVWLLGAASEEKLHEGFSMKLNANLYLPLSVVEQFSKSKEMPSSAGGSTVLRSTDVN
jgi:hypothetical protein